MEIWGMKATYQSKSDDIQFSAWVLQDMSQEDRTLFSHPAGPIKGAEQQVDSRVIKFHDLKAGIGVLEHRDAPEQEPDRHGRIQAPRSAFFVFRMKDKLFLFCSRDLAPIDRIEKTLLSFAEEVYQRNIDKKRSEPINPRETDAPMTSTVNRAAVNMIRICAIARGTGS